MAKLSRVEKNKNRNELTNETIGSEFQSEELKKFQDRLNKISADHFAPTQTFSKVSDYDPVHLRRSNVHTEEEDESIPEDDEFNLQFNQTRAEVDQNELTNDYLSRYINEVKQYNIDQGNAASANTSFNILSKMQKETPSTPYPSRRSTAKQNFKTTEVPFINTQVTPSGKPSSYTKEDAMMSADDIRARIADYTNEEEFVEKKPKQETSHPARMSTDEFTRQLELERTTNQQLLTQTTQMQARMEDVGDHLNDVTNHMRRTNQILNIVLIAVIVALIVVFAILIYWIVLTGGGR